MSSSREQSPAGSQRVNAVTPEEAAFLLGQHACQTAMAKKAAQQPPCSARKRPAAEMTELMVCSLCEARCRFVHEEADEAANDELICTNCGAVVDAMSDRNHRPFRLPLQAAVYAPPDFEEMSMLTKEPAAASTPPKMEGEGCASPILAMATSGVVR